MARQMFNVANIKYYFLSNDGHSVRFLTKIKQISAQDFLNLDY